MSEVVYNVYVNGHLVTKTPLIYEEALELVNSYKLFKVKEKDIDIKEEEEDEKSNL